MTAEWTEIQYGQISIFKEARGYLIAVFGILQQRNNINGLILIPLCLKKLKVIEFMNHMLAWHMKEEEFVLIGGTPNIFCQELKKQAIMLYN
jgi:hypothetical protein